MTTEPKLLTRDQFREFVFARAKHKCVFCSSPAKDAHHIIERRLWPDGGYYPENGAAVCEPCHIKCETTEITCEEVRRAAGITLTLLPPHLYPDHRYDKWGNPYVYETEGRNQRLRGELFDDESVRYILRAAIERGEFVNRVKYPRTYHVPWSPGATKDDRMHYDTVFERLLKERAFVMTEKMDGENTTMYRDGLHARSLEYEPHESRSWVKKLHGEIAHEIPEGWRICGENLYAKHSIHYTDLESFFLVFSIWNEENMCLPWHETQQWAELLGLKTVPELAVMRPDYDKGADIDRAFEDAKKARAGGIVEGYVLRPFDSFSFKDFRNVVGKYVRKDHVTTHGHWMRQRVVPNKLKGT